MTNETSDRTAWRSVQEGQYWLLLHYTDTAGMSFLRCMDDTTALAKHLNALEERAREQKGLFEQAIYNVRFLTSVVACGEELNEADHVLLNAWKADVQVLLSRYDQSTKSREG